MYCFCKCPFLTFPDLTASTPACARAVLTSGWVLHLQRDQNTSLHSTIINMLNRGKDKKKVYL